MGIFDSLAGSPTLNKQTQSPTQRDHGIFDPSLPFPPLWSEDGHTRYGFKRWFNGYVRGPEGTSLAQLQAAVNTGMIPGIHPNSAGQYPTLSSQDYFDAMYIQVGQTSLYDTYVRAVPATPNGDQPDFPPPAPPVIPVDPNPQPNPQPGTQPPVPTDLCAAVKLELALAQRSLTAVNASLDAANATIKSINKVINGLTIPVRGGGAAWNALRQIGKILS